MIFCNIFIPEEKQINKITKTTMIANKNQMHTIFTFTLKHKNSIYISIRCNFSKRKKNLNHKILFIIYLQNR